MRKRELTVANVSRDYPDKIFFNPFGQCVCFYQVVICDGHQKK